MRENLKRLNNKDYETLLHQNQTLTCTVLLPIHLPHEGASGDVYRNTPDPSGPIVHTLEGLEGGCAIKRNPLQRMEPSGRHDLSSVLAAGK